MPPRSKRPPIAPGPVELPAPSDLPHVSTTGTIDESRRGVGLTVVHATSRALDALRSVLPRGRRTAPTKSDS